MNFLLLNQDWFADELKSLGHNVVTAGNDPHLSVQLPPLTNIRNALEGELAGFNPDVVIWYDNSSPLYYFGLEELKAKTIFYTVDTHHHLRVHRFLAHLFDLTLIAHKDYIPGMEEYGISPVWFPLWASRIPKISNQRTKGAVFVGTLNPDLNPERVTFFEELKKLAEVEVLQANWWEVFSDSKIVINQTVKKDLNFRVFEAMSSGALLLTEKIENGLFELFKEGEHLVTYEKGNAKEAAEKIRYYLSNESERQRIAKLGMEEVRLFHSPLVRAKTLLELAVKTEKKASSRLRGFANVITRTCLLRKIENGELFNALLRDTKELANSLAEPLDEECFIEIFYLAFVEPDFEFLRQFLDRYPNSMVLTCAVIYMLKEAGKIEEAKDLAKRSFAISVEDAFANVNALVSSIKEAFL